MKKPKTVDSEKKEKIWESLKAVVIRDLQFRRLEESEVGEITPQSKLVNLGLRDSLERRLHGFNWLNLVHVIDDLEEEFSIEIDHDRLLEFKTLEDILKCLLRKVSFKENLLRSGKVKTKKS